MSYNEVTNSSSSSSSDVNCLDPMYHWDTHFPERMSQHHMNSEFSSPVARRTRKDRRSRNNARFKTQPITFDEIQEEVEDGTIAVPTKLKEGLKTEFAAFSRSMDGLVPSIRPGIKTKAVDRFAPVPKENVAVVNVDPLQERMPLDGASGDSASDDARPETALIDLSNQKVVIMPNLSDSSRNRRQKRFKKKQRHNRSIEEAPELDRNTEEEAVR